MKEFFYTVKSDFIKTRHTFATRLFWIGIFFIPVIYFFVDNIYKYYTVATMPTFWGDTWSRNWQNMGMLVSLGIIVGTGQIFQTENKNNGWKQVFTYPRTITEIFFSKYLTVLLITALSCLLFIIVFSIEGVAVNLIINKKLPVYFPALLNWTGQLLIYLLMFTAIISFQFLLNVIFKNPVISISIGIVFWILGQIKYIFFMDPFSLFGRYIVSNGTSHLQTAVIILEAISHILIYTGAAYFIFYGKKEKS